MIEKISLRIFLVCMLLCASVAVIAIWFSPDDSSPFNRLVPTFFIIGFANFLIWAVSMVYRVVDVLSQKK